MRALFCCLALVLATATTMSAQSRPGRPYRGLFGAGNTDFEQQLSVSGSAGVGYDSSVLAEAANAGLGGSPTAPSSSGGYALASGSVNYALNKDGFGATANLGSLSRYYPTLTQGYVRNSYGTGGVSYNRDLSRRTRFNVGQNVSYQPFTIFSPYPVLFETPFEQVVNPSQDVSTVMGTNTTFQTTAGFNHQLSRKSSMSLSYDRYQALYSSGTVSDLLTHTAGARYNRTLSRYMGMHLGYGYTNTDFSAAPHVGSHNIDAGLDYSRTLTLDRRTKFAFTTGTAMVAYSGETHFYVTGSATLTREFGRTWDFAASYARHVSVQPTLTAPVISDAANVGITGLIDRHWSLSANAGTSIGNVGFGRNGFDTLYAMAELSTALSRYLSLGFDYSYYQYQFDNREYLAPELMSETDRNSVRVRLSVWAPVVQRNRRSNASR